MISWQELALRGFKYRMCHTQVLLTDYGEYKSDYPKYDCFPEELLEKWAIHQGYKTMWVVGNTRKLLHIKLSKSQRRTFRKTSDYKHPESESEAQYQKINSIVEQLEALPSNEQLIRSLAIAIEERIAMSGCWYMNDTFLDPPEWMDILCKIATERGLTTSSSNGDIILSASRQKWEEAVYSIERYIYQSS